MPTTAPTSTPTANAGTLFVTTAATSGPVVAYSASASGTPAPLYTLATAGFNQPTSLATDSSGNLYVLNTNGGSVLVFAKGATTASKTITSSALVGPETSVAVDAAGNVYVLGNVAVAGVGTTYGVAVFAPSASANATPTETYTNTASAAVVGIGVDASGTMYVATASPNGNAIFAFAAGATGNATPVRTIAGAATTLGANALNGIAVDASGTIYASVAQSTVNAANEIAVFAPGANGNVAPARVIAGAATQLANPTSLALDTAGELLVQNAPPTANAYVTVYAAGASGAAAPVRTIGPATGSASMRNGAIAVAAP